MFAGAASVKFIGIESIVLVEISVIQLFAFAGHLFHQ
jgi:hypothetical protein